MPSSADTHAYVHAYMHACMRTHMHTNVRTHVHSRVHFRAPVQVKLCLLVVMGGRVLPREKGCLHPHIYVRTNIHTRTHTHRHACMHTYLHAHKHTRARVCLCGCVHVSTCTRTHIHTYIDALAHTSKCERGRTSKRKSRDQGRLGHRTRRHFFLGWGRSVPGHRHSCSDISAPHTTGLRLES